MEHVGQVRAMRAGGVRCRRSRVVIAAVVVGALALYGAGIVWFAQDLGEDVRAGIRTIPAGALLLEYER